MLNVKKEQEYDKLHRAIWAIADELRGNVNGWNFKKHHTKNEGYYTIDI